MNIVIKEAVHIPEVILHAPCYLKYKTPFTSIIEAYNILPDGTAIKVFMLDDVVHILKDKASSMNIHIQNYEYIDEETFSGIYKTALSKLNI